MQLTVEAVRAAGQRALIYPEGQGYFFHIHDPHHPSYGLGWPAVAAAEVLGCKIKNNYGEVSGEVDTVLASLIQLVREKADTSERYLAMLDCKPKYLGHILLELARLMEAKECYSQ